MKKANKKTKNNSITDTKKSNKKQTFYVVISSIFIGLLNGFFGGGGGMVAVPLLEKVLHVENKKAHATAIAVILPLSVVSASFYFAKNSFEFNWIFYASIGVFFGGFIGAVLLKKLSGKVVRFIFAMIMLFAGLKMVF